MSAWRWLFGRRGADAELAREIDAHIAERVDDLMDEGVSEADAKAQARREFGNKTLQIERSREVWIAPWLSSVLAGPPLRGTIRRPAAGIRRERHRHSRARHRSCHGAVLDVQRQVAAALAGARSVVDRDRQANSWTERAVRRPVERGVPLPARTHAHVHASGDVDAWRRPDRLRQDERRRPVELRQRELLRHARCPHADGAGVPGGRRRLHVAESRRGHQRAPLA